MASSVKDVIAKLDAAKLQEESDRIARMKALEENARKEAELEAERRKREKVHSVVFLEELTF
jgi:hypothetical protein